MKEIKYEDAKRMDDCIYNKNPILKGSIGNLNLELRLHKWIKKIKRIENRRYFFSEEHLHIKNNRRGLKISLPEITKNEAIYLFELEDIKITAET